jgi:hypothetical protein
VVIGGGVVELVGDLPAVVEAVKSLCVQACSLTLSNV